MSKPSEVPSVKPRGTHQFKLSHPSHEKLVAGVSPKGTKQYPLTHPTGKGYPSLNNSLAPKKFRGGK